MMKSGVAFLLATSVLGQDWSILHKDFDTILIDLAFSSATDGILPYGDNGGTTPIGVKLTTDGGQTYVQNGNVAPGSSLLLCCAAKSNIAVMGGVFDFQYSSDSGQTWNRSTHNSVVGQSYEALRDPTDTHFFGATGSDIVGRNGVFITKDGGVSFEPHNISIATTFARYGAFPSKDTWYVAAGEWPQTTEKKDNSLVHELSHRVRLHKENGKMVRKVVTETPERVDEGWMAEILKTTDGGSTWTSQYSKNDFYFNQIDCADETHCCAVGEADTSARPGIRIHCTNDGMTWNEVYYYADPNESTMTIRALSTTEYWMGAGHLTNTNFYGYFAHTTDGGKTWANTTDTPLKGVYADSQFFWDGKHGWATALDRDGQSSMLIYT